MASLIQTLNGSDPTAPAQTNDHGGRFSVNVGRSERLASAVTGSLMVAYGLSKKSAGGLLIAAIGGAVAYRGVTGRCALYERFGLTTVDADGDGHTPGGAYNHHGVHVEVSLTVGRPRQELYDFWRDFTNLPRFMQHLKRVTVQDDGRSHWVAEGPAGTTVAWEADVINEKPGELIAWSSVAGGDVDTAGSVRFLDSASGKGTDVKVSMSYVPPGGKLGAVVARLFNRSGETEVREDLLRFKQMMEAGETAATTAA